MLTVAFLALAAPETGLAQDQTGGARVEPPLRGEDVVDLRQWDWQRLYADGWRAGGLLGAEPGAAAWAATCAPAVAVALLVAEAR